jgi:hypothetical protein
MPGLALDLTVQDATPVSKRVNTPKNNDSELIAAARVA